MGTIWVLVLKPVQLMVKVCSKIHYKDKMIKQFPFLVVLTILDHLSLRSFIKHHRSWGSPGVLSQGIGSSAPHPELEDEEDDSDAKDHIEPHVC